MAEGDDPVTTIFPLLQYDICTETCNVHKNKLIKYFCSKHEKLGCSACIMVDHRNCEGVDYIASMAEDLLEKTEYHYLTRNIGLLKEKSTKIISAATDNVLQIEDNCHKELSNQNRLLKEELKKVNVRGKSVQSEVLEYKSSETKRMKQVLDVVNKAVQKLENFDSEIEKLAREKQYRQLYITMKRTNSRLTECHQFLYKQETASKISPCPIQCQGRKRRLENMESTSNSTAGPSDAEGIKVPKHTNENTLPRTITDLSDIHVKTASDSKMVCNIADSVVLPGHRLVIIDSYNFKIKLVDTVQHKTISELKVPTAPLRLTVMDKGRVAVALCEGQNTWTKLLIVLVTRTLSADRLITSPQSFRGDPFTYYKGCFLIVNDRSSNPSYLKMDMMGESDNGI